MTGALIYNAGVGEIVYDTTKTFFIPHPITSSKCLVHACLEGPEACIYYRGKSSVTNDNDTVIELPDYVDYVGSEFTIQITKIFSGKESLGKSYDVSEVTNGKFTVYGPNGSFYWLVHAKRNNINVEPNVNDYNLCGDGPYTYIKKKIKCISNMYNTQNNTLCVEFFNITSFQLI